MIFKQQFYSAGNYARLSDEDDRDGESGSIDSQRKIMQQFCEANTFQVAGFYADDGYSGTNFDRPHFQRMIFDIKQGKVNLVIVKDLSRFARNAGGAAYYVDMFEEYNVRFIAIDDGVDTLRGDDIVLPLKNVVNELYAKDISK
ncbi:MAG: recombinase family protein, partial [Firmicutes bacterium]|nr:recombinase family protein [Bacillota bacterium]